MNARELLAQVSRVIGPRVNEAVMTAYEQLIAEGKIKGELEGRRQLLAKLLRRVLGDGKEVETLIERLILCDNAALDDIGILLVECKDKRDLVPAVERLLSKGTSST